MKSALSLLSILSLTAGAARAELAASFESGGVQDVRADRLPALLVKAGESPTPFLPPGQFTVLNSPRREVVASSITELEYHTAFLDALGLDRSHKVVVHMGGIYDDKNQSLKRFIATCRRLDRTVLGRLVIENDERCYSIADALIAAQKIGVPVVFDVFHHRWNPAHESLGLRGIIQASAATWLAGDGRPKIHYSNQWPGQPKGTHSKTISVQKFRDFYKQIDGLEIDVMLEVKDKERSVLKLRQSLPVLSRPVDLPARFRGSRGAV